MKYYDKLPINERRAGWAGHALSSFMQTTGCDQDTALSDLLCDLMHWASQHGEDFNQALDQGRRHYEVEIIEDAEVRS